MKHPLLRLKWFTNATRARLNPHGIWLPVHLGPASWSGLERTTIMLEKGTIAVQVGEYRPRARERVYLAGGMLVILEDRELEHAK